MDDRALMESIHHLLRLGVGVVFVILGLTTVVIGALLRTARRTIRMQMEVSLVLQDVADVLPLVRAWAESARTNARESRVATSALKDKFPDVLESRNRMIEAVDSVPEKTADKVIEKLHDSAVLPPQM